MGCLEAVYREGIKNRVDGHLGKGGSHRELGKRLSERFRIDYRYPSEKPWKVCIDKETGEEGVDALGELLPDDLVQSVLGDQNNLFPEIEDKRIAILWALGG
ncbi:hypothetical protein HOG48_00795 [Candidatus Peregrinibacteria bacterium]|nr:hypothetical protein [Candidatus Peregrinibacteria bacterium]